MRDEIRDESVSDSYVRHACYTAVTLHVTRTYVYSLVFASPSVDSKILNTTLADFGEKNNNDGMPPYILETHNLPGTTIAVAFRPPIIGAFHANVHRSRVI